MEVRERQHIAVIRGREIGLRHWLWRWGIRIISVGPIIERGNHRLDWMEVLVVLASVIVFTSAYCIAMLFLTGEGITIETNECITIVLSFGSIRFLMQVVNVCLAFCLLTFLHVCFFRWTTRHHGCGCLGAQ